MSTRQPPPARSSRVVLATYNIHRGIGTDGVADPDRIGRVLREIDADVVALQEVGASPAASTDELLAALCAVTGMQAVEGYTLRDGEGHYGNALLTRLAPHTVERLDLSVGEREPRGALIAGIDLADVRLRVVATHLGLRAGERRRQLDWLEPWLTAAPDGVTALLGDVNEWRPLTRIIRQLDTRLGRSPRRASFPAGRPLLALDRIWIHPRERLARLEAHKSPLARVASDHLPVVAHLTSTDPATAPRGARAGGGSSCPG